MRMEMRLFFVWLSAFYFNFLGGTVVPVLLFIFIASHAIGQGAVIWVFISEIFPNNVRAYGQSLGCTTHWILAAIITTVFPIMATRFGPAPLFLFFAFMMVLQLLWVIFKMPETKGVPLEGPFLPARGLDRRVLGGSGFLQPQDLVSRDPEDAGQLRHRLA